MSNNCKIEAFPRWLSIKLAAKYCPLYGEKHLIELVKSKVVKGGQLQDKGTKNWFIDRDSLDDYMSGQCLDSDFERKIIENFNRVV